MKQKYFFGRVPLLLAGCLALQLQGCMEVPAYVDYSDAGLAERDDESLMRLVLAKPVTHGDWVLSQRASAIMLARKPWDEAAKAKIKDHAVWVGMTSEQALLSRGSPAEKDRIADARGVSETWIYRSGGTTLFLQLEDDVVVSWNETER